MRADADDDLVTLLVDRVGFDVAGQLVPLPEGTVLRHASPRRNLGGQWLGLLLDGRAVRFMPVPDPRMDWYYDPAISGALEKALATREPASDGWDGEPW